MLPANRVDPRARRLKDYFATINESPRLAKDSPLLEKANLKRLATKLHLSADQLATTSDEQVRQIGKALTLSMFVPEYKKETRDASLLQGLLCFWHAYLSPISPSHPAPSVSSVIVYCSDVSNLREFLLEAQRWVSAAYSYDPPEIHTVLGLFTPENIRKTVVGGLPTRPTDSERRTYGNYLNASARELALRLESLVPELFAERVEARRKANSETEQAGGMAITMPGPEVTIQVHPPEQVAWVAHQMIGVGFRLPGPGAENLRADGFLERTLDSRTLRGRVHIPAFLSGAAADVKGMSGLLSGELGSGRTAFLKFLTYQYALQFHRKGDGVLPYYFAAADFVIYARNRRSIYDFIGDTLAGLGGNTEGIEQLPDMLRALDQAGKLLLLVDDLDRLSDADQGEVLSQLAFSPAVVFAVLPWQVERLAGMTPRSQLGVFTLPPLTPREQVELLEGMGHATDAVYDIRFAEQLLRELPDLAQMPLGVITILQEVQQDWTDSTKVVETALGEYLRRAGFPPAPSPREESAFSNEWFHLRSATFDLLLTIKESGGYERLEGETDVTVWREMVENKHGYAWRMNWDQVSRTGLFRPVLRPSGEGLELINRDLTCYLLALVAWEKKWNLELPPYPLHPQAVQLLRRAGRHIESLKNPHRGLDIRQLIARPRALTAPSQEPKIQKWRGLLPEIFRILS